MQPVLKMILKLAVLLVSFPVVVACAFIFFPMHTYDDQYAVYLENEEYAKGHDQYCRVLIMGDSSAKVSLQPGLLAEDVYNYAVIGASPIEEYYYLREYLEHNKAPEVLIYMSVLTRLLSTEVFWTRAMHFHRISDEVLADIEERLTMFDDLSPLEVSSVEEFKREEKLYKMYAPQKYSEAFLKSIAKGLIGTSRYKQNTERYNELKENKGHMLIGNAQYYDKAEKDYREIKDYDASEMAEYYLRALIELCEENGIRFVFQSPPYNVSSKPVLRESVIEEYLDYMDRIQKAYPNTTINAEWCWYGPEYFSDATHVNQGGG